MSRASSAEGDQAPAQSAGLGLVETQRVVLFDEDHPLKLESRASIAPVEVAYETYGELNRERSNAVFVLHALTGDAHAAGHHGEPERRGWWDNMIGPRRPLDTERLFVVCPNLLGGCQGSTGPSSIDPASGRAYGLRFPLFTISDLVAVHRALMHKLGIERLRCAIGGSLGGMQALQWALSYPGEISLAPLVCATARLSAQNIALSAAARAAILADPDFQDGDYVGSGRTPTVGLAVARRLAHITYLSEEGMERKFGPRRRGPRAPMTLAPDFEVEHYLEHQAESFVRRFDALSYLYLSRTMDYFDPFADPRLDLTRVRTNFLLVSFDSDWRFGRAHSRRIAASLARGPVGGTIEHVEISSPWGHDSFLLDPPGYHELIARFLGTPAVVRDPAGV